jgi:hypothetical protein
MNGLDGGIAEVRLQPHKGHEPRRVPLRPFDHSVVVTRIAGVGIDDWEDDAPVDSHFVHGGDPEIPTLP